MTNKLMWALKHERDFNVSPLVMEAMIDAKEIHLFKDGDTIVEKGQPITSFIISL
jgi:hypothetical protein